MTGSELKNARKASSWTQVQAANRLGVTQAYLSMVERGERAISDELALRAANVFEVPATALPLADYQAGKDTPTTAKDEDNPVSHAGMGGSGMGMKSY